MFPASSVLCRARVDLKHGTMVQGPMCYVSRTIYVNNNRSLIKALLCLHNAPAQCVVRSVPPTISMPHWIITGRVNKHAGMLIRYMRVNKGHGCAKKLLLGRVLHRFKWNKKLLANIDSLNPINDILINTILKFLNISSGFCIYCRLFCLDWLCTQAERRVLIGSITSCPYFNCGIPQFTSSLLKLFDPSLFQIFLQMSRATQPMILLINLLRGLLLTHRKS